jgi:pentatricopeptide repeat protein
MRPAAFAIVLGLAACEGKKPAPAPAAKGEAAAAPARTAPPAAPRPPRAWTRPVTPPRQAVTEGAWSRGEAENTAEAWGKAAEAYEAELATCAEGCADTAYTIVLARKNALLAEPIEPPPGEEPVPVPPAVEALVEALDAFVAIADPADPDVAGLKFLAGNALAKWRQPDALARLEEVLREHRDHETAEYAANVLLDALLRAGRVDEVSALVEELIADDAFLASRPALRQTLERLRAVIAEARR